jgi:hypothetical protein
MLFETFLQSEKSMYRRVRKHIAKHSHINLTPLKFSECRHIDPTFRAQPCSKIAGIPCYILLSTTPPRTYFYRKHSLEILDNMGGSLKPEIDLIPWDPDSLERVERLLQQRIACGWNQERIPEWQVLQRSGTNSLQWVVS